LQELARDLMAAQTKSRPKQVGKVTVEGQQRGRLLLHQTGDKLQQLTQELTRDGGQVAWSGCTDK